MERGGADMILTKSRRILTNSARSRSGNEMKQSADAEIREDIRAMLEAECLNPAHLLILRVGVLLGEMRHSRKKEDKKLAEHFIARWRLDDAPMEEAQPAAHQQNVEQQVQAGGSSNVLQNCFPLHQAPMSDFPIDQLMNAEDIPIDQFFNCSAH